MGRTITDSKATLNFSIWRFLKTVTFEAGIFIMNREPMND